MRMCGSSGSKVDIIDLWNGYGPFRKRIRIFFRSIQKKPHRFSYSSWCWIVIQDEIPPLDSSSPTHRNCVHRFASTFLVHRAFLPRSHRTPTPFLSQKLTCWRTSGVLSNMQYSFFILVLKTSPCRQMTGEVLFQCQCISSVLLITPVDFTSNDEDFKRPCLDSIQSFP